MISLNTILENEGLNPKNVKLVRHRDRRFSITPYQLWMAADGRLDVYQSFQSRLVFEGVSHIASFVVTPLNETLFVGVYAVNGVGLASADDIDPLSNASMVGLNKYDLTLTDHMADYRGKLVIDWGGGFRSWVQKAGRQDKTVVEIRRVVEDQPFPGFIDFQSQLSGLVMIPVTWRTALSSVGGVYLLVSPGTGRQYIGAAYGDGGFWARWEEYVRTGHGGNVRMREVPDDDYKVAILEVAPSTASFDNIMEMEARWKRKLLTREFGLNAN